MARHAPRHGVNPELHGDSVRLHQFTEEAHRRLRSGHRHAVAGNKRHLLCRLEDHRHLFRGGALHTTGVDIVFVLLGGGRGADAAEEHIGQGAVHGAAHDIGENETTGTHQGTGDNQHRVGEYEAGGGGGDAGVGVEQGDDDRHVRSTNRHDQQDSQE